LWQWAAPTTEVTDTGVTETPVTPADAQTYQGNNASTGTALINPKPEKPLGQKVMEDNNAWNAARLKSPPSPQELIGLKVPSSQPAGPQLPNNNTP